MYLLILVYFYQNCTYIRMIAHVNILITAIAFCCTFRAVNSCVICTETEVNTGTLYYIRYMFKFNIWINDKINWYENVPFITSILECSGNVVLSSNFHDVRMEIQAEDLKRKRGNRKRIRNRRDGQLLQFDYVEKTGSCRWSVWSKSRSGESFQVDQTGIQEPGWPIRAVKLLISN